MVQGWPPTEMLEAGPFPGLVESRSTGQDFKQVDDMTRF